MKQVQGTEYQSVKDTAAILGISPETLRGYSNQIEKVAGDSRYFERSKAGSRLYTEKQINDLKAMIELKQNGNETLSSAISSVFANVNKTGVPNNVPNVPNGSEGIMKMLKKMVDRDEKQSQEMVELKQMVERQSEEIDQLTKAIETKPKKRHWWPF